MAECPLAAEFLVLTFRVTEENALFARGAKRDPLGPNLHLALQRFRCADERLPDATLHGRIIGLLIGNWPLCGSFARVRGRCQNRPPEVCVPITVHLASEHLLRDIDEKTPRDTPATGHRARTGAVGLDKRRPAVLYRLARLIGRSLDVEAPRLRNRPDQGRIRRQPMHRYTSPKDLCWSVPKGSEPERDIARHCHLASSQWA